MVKLYDLALEWERVLLKLDAAEGVVDEELEAELEGISVSFVDKVEATATMIRILKAHAELVKSEEQRLAARRKALEGNAEWLTTYAMSCLRTAGETKVKGKLFTVSIQKNPPSVKLSVPAEECPVEFVRTSIVHEVDKAAVKAALVAGEALEFATLEQTERLVVK
jgi:hypothetical protein